MEENSSALIDRKETMERYSWTNDRLWQIVIDQQDFEQFEQPYIGNGVLGTRFGKLVAGTEGTRMPAVSKSVYDGGKQLFLPSWCNLSLSLDGMDFKPENGAHHASQVMDMRNGLITLQDEWEYKQEKHIHIEIELFIPRGFENASYLSISAAGLTEAAELTFGLDGEGLSDRYDMAFSTGASFELYGHYYTKIQKRQVAQALKYIPAGLTIKSTEKASDKVLVSSAATGDSFRLQLYHAACSYATGSDPSYDVEQKITMLAAFGRDKLFDASARHWKKCWETALAFRNPDLEKEKALIAHQFYLLCSLEKGDDPLGPLGLSNNEWGGNQLWDADFWIFRAILPLWTEYARSIVEFRRKTLPGAQRHAQMRGFQGAWYGWQTNENGDNITILRFNDELHINIWIALAAWEYYRYTHDREFLLETAWPVISEIADFFVSRSELEPDGLYHINCVLGPDEAVCECGQYRVDDNFLTNFGVTRLMEAAIHTAQILGKEGNKRWRELKDRIYLLKPDSCGIIPEYEGYAGAGIKQADIILAFYPLELEAGEDIIRKNIKYYRDKQMYYGPMMSFQIESCLMMKLGEKEAGLKRLFEGMTEFSRGKHYTPYECRDNDNSVMLTGIAGELQALIYGFYGASVEDANCLPRMKQYMEDGGDLSRIKQSQRPSHINQSMEE